MSKHRVRQRDIVRCIPCFTRPAALALALLLTGAAAALAAQLFTERRFLLIGALSLWLAGMALGPREPPAARSVEALPPPASAGLHLPGLLASLGLAVLTFWMASGNRFSPANVTAWVLSVVTFLYVAWERV